MIAGEVQWRLFSNPSWPSLSYFLKCTMQDCLNPSWASVDRTSMARTPTLFEAQGDGFKVDNGQSQSLRQQDTHQLCSPALAVAELSSRPEMDHIGHRSTGRSPACC